LRAALNHHNHKEVEPRQVDQEVQVDSEEARAGVLDREVDLVAALDVQAIVSLLSLQLKW